MAEPEKNNSPGHPHPLSYEIKVQILPIWGEENMDAVVQCLTEEPEAQTTSLVYLVILPRRTQPQVPCLLTPPRVRCFQHNPLAPTKNRRG